MHALMRYRLKLRRRFILVLLVALSGVAASIPQAPRTSAAGSDPVIHWDSNMIYPGQNNGYPWGPVGEHASVHGEKFTDPAVVGQSVNLALLPGDVNNPPGGGSSYEFCKLAVPKIAIGQTHVDGSGMFDFNFDWPAAAGSGSFSICAYNTQDGLPAGNIDDGPFTVLANSAPSIAISRTAVPVGESITVTGTHWTPPQAVNVYIATCVDCDGPIVVAGTAHSSGLNSGTFSITFTIPDSVVPGDYVAGANAHSVLDVGPAGAKHMTITAAVAPTPTVAPTTAQATVAAGTGAGGSGNAVNGGNGSSVLMSPLVLLLLGTGLLLLVVLIITAIVLLSRRGARQTPPGMPGSPVPGWGSPGPTADGYVGVGGAAAPPAGGSVQQNWTTLPPGWGDQTPPTVTPNTPQGGPSSTQPNISHMADPALYPPAPPAAYPPLSGDAPTQPGRSGDTPPEPNNPYSG